MISWQHYTESKNKTKKNSLPPWTACDCIWKNFAAMMNEWNEQKWIKTFYFITDIFQFPHILNTIHSTNLNCKRLYYGAMVKDWKVDWEQHLFIKLKTLEIWVWMYFNTKTI